MDTINFERATHAGLLRFAEAVDTVMEAPYLCTEQKVALIAHWAYQYKRPDMPEQLQAAVKRCQENPLGLVETVRAEVDLPTAVQPAEGFTQEERRVLRWLSRPVNG